jgi:uncharacterized protein involved in exopolysaccharide biosynthesis
MSSTVDSIHIEPSGWILNAALASLWRRKVLLVAIVVIALVLGLIAVFVMPARYTAQAYVRGEFFAAPDTIAKDDESTTAGSTNLDLVRVIETESRLLESHLLARRVVQQLGLERLRPLVSERQLLPAAFFDSEAKTSEDEVDIAATRLLPGLSVTSDPRAYLLTVRYSAGDPALAELIANGFVAELLRSANLQKLFKQRSLAQDQLSTQLAKFGDKHPGVAQSRTRLAASDELIKEQLNKGQEAILQATGENVTKATFFPSSRKFVIGLFLLGGLAISVGVALWLERGRWWIVLDPSLRPAPSH